MTRDSTLDQQQVSFSIDTYDFKILYGAANVTHVAGHFLALEYSARRLVLTNGARRTMRQRVTVRRVLHAEVPTLNGTGEAFTNRRTYDINFLACLEKINFKFVAFLEFTVDGVFKPKLHQ